MTTIEREQRTVSQMVHIYCRGQHHPHPHASLCPECDALLAYATARLRSCKFGHQKSSCQDCPVHCYKPAMREHIRRVMRYAGPRMLFHHPITALRHLFRHLAAKVFGPRS